MDISEGFYYFNSGVMLMNLSLLREMKFTEKVYDYYKSHKDIIKMHDQDILNGLLYRERHPLDERWNMMCNTDNVTDYAIIHFAGIKPWYIECPHPLKGIYYEYLQQTQWKFVKPIHGFSLWRRLIMTVKRWQRFVMTVKRR